MNGPLPKEKKKKKNKKKRKSVGHGLEASGGVKISDDDKEA